MIQSPLKKKFQLTLNTSRGNRYSIQESSNGFSKSPFKGSTNQLIKCSQLEQELHRANQQRKLLALELDEMSSQYMKKSKALQECELENAILQQQLQATRQQDEIQKLHNLLRQKNQIILEWTNKFQQIEKKLEGGNNVEQQLKQQQSQNDTMKQQLSDIKRQLKTISDNYKELKEERNQYYQRFMETQVQTGSQEQRIKALESEKNNLQQQLTNNDNQKLQAKKDKWKLRYRNLMNVREFEQIKSRKSSENSIIPNEELSELKDKLQQLEMENQYLREQNIDMQTQIEGLTDKLLKQQLQSSMSREQSQAFSFQQYHQCESINEEQEQQD